MTFSSTRIQTREIFSVQGSCGEAGAGSGAAAGGLLMGSGWRVGISAAAVGTGKAGPAPSIWAAEAGVAGWAPGGGGIGAFNGEKNRVLRAPFAGKALSGAFGV